MYPFNDSVYYIFTVLALGYLVLMVGVLVLFLLIDTCRSGLSVVLSALVQQILPARNEILGLFRVEAGYIFAALLILFPIHGIACALGTFLVFIINYDTVPFE